MNNKYIFLTIFIIIGFTFTLGCTESNDNSKQAVQSESAVATPSSSSSSGVVATPNEAQNTPSEYNRSLVKNYEIVKEDDISMKPLTKPLSSYSPEELNSLPMNIRMVYKVVISPNITKEELKSTLIQVVMDKTSKNKDIDEVSVFAYDRKEEVNFAYNLGTVDWCPNGDWGSMTPEIASSNDRSSYKYVFNIKDQVGNINLSERPTEREYEIYDTYNKYCSME